MHISTSEEEAVVIQTLRMVGVALARQLRCAVFQWGTGEKVQGAGLVSRGIEDLV